MIKQKEYVKIIDRLNQFMREYADFFNLQTIQLTEDIGLYKVWVDIIQESDIDDAYRALREATKLDSVFDFIQVYMGEYAEIHNIRARVIREMKNESDKEFEKIGGRVTPKDLHRANELYENLMKVKKKRPHLTDIDIQRHTDEAERAVAAGILDGKMVK